MLLIPAIDIKNNFCVRLKKGKTKNISIFSKNPILVINKWLNSNIKRIHLIDLDGAFKGKPKNLIILKNLLYYINDRIETQVGGGIRDMDTIEYYFDIGVSYIILGTKAILDFKFLENVCKKYPEKIILSLDFKNSKIAIEGWKKTFSSKIFKINNFFKIINYLSLNSLIITDIKNDGMLKGLNLNFFFKFLNVFNKPLIISGGLSNLKDLINIFNKQYKNILGVICGTSIYSGNLNFKKIQSKINIFNKFYI